MVCDFFVVLLRMSLGVSSAGLIWVHTNECAMSSYIHIEYAIVNDYTKFSDSEWDKDQEA